MCVAFTQEKYNLNCIIFAFSKKSYIKLDQNQDSVLEDWEVRSLLQGTKVFIFNLYQTNVQSTDFPSMYVHVSCSAMLVRCTSVLYMWLGFVNYSLVYTGTL